MDLLEFVKAYYKNTGRLPTEREMAEIGSRMEGSNKPTINYTRDLPYDVAGRYSPSKPNQVFINQDIGDPSALIHELEHQGQWEKAGLMNTFSGRSGRDYNLKAGNLPNNFNKDFSDDFFKALRDTFSYKNDTNAEVRKALESTEKDPRFQEAFTASNSGLDSQETMSNIAEYIATLPSGVSLKDTPLGKELVRLGVYPMIISALNSRQMTESENLPTPQPKVNPKASYARQALQYLGFKDPFEDTTKD